MEDEEGDDETSVNMESPGMECRDRVGSDVNGVQLSAHFYACFCYRRIPTSDQYLVGNASAYASSSRPYGDDGATDDSHIWIR